MIYSENINGLSPSQQKGYDRILLSMGKGNLIGILCNDGNGRTTLLRKLAQEKNTGFIRLVDVYENLSSLLPLQIQEGIVKTLTDALESHDLVICDDYHKLEKVLNSCYDPARPNILPVSLDAVLKSLEGGNKQLILGLENRHIDKILQDRCVFVSIPKFRVDDFSYFFKTFTGEVLEQLDFKQIHHFAPHLSIHKIKTACLFIEPRHFENTETFIAFLEKHALVSNVSKEEVEQVKLSDLYGVDEVVRQLEINVTIPMERKDLAKELNLSPKRGILLYGPPGTGKTTIGRALAHQLGSKFFLLDGTVISGTNRFYQKLERIIRDARKNAPSVLFIDDCDVLFEGSQETGLYRYLLTILDGLESKTNSKITIMLTAMNIGSLPPALIRSGRVELWLEMKVPDHQARLTILGKRIEKSPFELSETDLNTLAMKTEGFTGADLKRLISDASNLYGYDLVKEIALNSYQFYLERAIEQLLFHREQLASAPKFTAAHNPAGKFGE